MPKPAYPAPGDEIVATWAQQVTDFAAEHWRFVPIPFAGTAVGGTNGIVAHQLLEITSLPANDPTVVAANLLAMCRDLSGATGSAGGGTQACNVFHYDDTLAMTAIATGVFGRGTYNGPTPVIVGGVNNRQVRWNGGLAGTACTCWIAVNGYWVREVKGGNA